MIKITTKIFQIIALCCAISLIGCGGGAETGTETSSIDPAAPVTDWKLIWSDEFDKNTIDAAKWTHEVNCDGGGNNEKQCYTDSANNSYIDNGMLNLVALPAVQGADQPYTSARINSRYKADFKYGRFEMRAKLPSGQGSWPAFWMMPTDEVFGGWPKSGEIDILEAVNLKTSDSEGNIESNVHGTLHYGKEWPDNSSSGKSYQLPNNLNPADGFHDYAIEWQEGEIRWYVDNYLYATQRKSQVRFNSKDQAVGLSHRGWFAEYFDTVSGELSTYWGTEPFDQEFYLVLNFAVGGNWPEAVNNLGVDSSVFESGQKFEIDFVRVYQCEQNTITGAGCETVRGGYDSLEDGLVEGVAPIPSPPSSGVAQNLTIFDGTLNPNWPAWDCCGGSTPSIVEDVNKGSVMEFTVGETPTVNGFISRDTFIDDPLGKATPFDASPLIDSGNVQFEMKIVTAPNDATAVWSFKIESQEGSTAVDMELNQSIEGVDPVTGEWQTYTFPLQTLADAGLDLSALDVVMIFPAWGVGEGTIYHVTNVTIAGDEAVSPQVVLFEDTENLSWPLWDCCGGSTPSVVTDEDLEHGATAEFSIGATPTVMGFISREPNTDSPSPFDATSILANGVIQFDMKAVSLPNDSTAEWLFKVESDEGDTAVEFSLSASIEGVVPAQGVWQTYTFNLSDLADGGLDASAIDVVMIFPAWGVGEGAVYRIDNAKIYDPNASTGFIGHVLFDDQTLEQWSIWDCCGGSTPTIENDDTQHGLTAEFIIGATPTVMGLLADDDVYLDTSNLLGNGIVQFEMKLMTAPTDSTAVWKFKIEAGDTTSAVEFDLSESEEASLPVVGQWQTYTYSVQDLFDAGLDISQIDVLMVFPEWGKGDGAVYRLDNIMIFDPTSLPAPQGLTIYDNAQNPEWPIWDCCGGSNPTEELDDDTTHGMVAEFVIGTSPTVMGFLANDDVYYDASTILQNGSVKFDLKVVTAPTDTSGAWTFKVESGDTTTAVELELAESQEGVVPTVGEWQTYTYSLTDLFNAGLDVSEIDVIMIFPTWGTGDGAVYRVDNVSITAP
ncbi:MAG: family 16 glycosylhydrolase [Kangiellaceae bacterium]|nr:family 16 glycosylhydrolase [Kangiellaceae bacterium]